MTSQPPIATYSEAQWGATRKFELFPEKLIVETRIGRVEVPLDGIRETPSPGTIIDRHRYNLVLTAFFVLPVLVVWKPWYSIAEVSPRMSLTIMLVLSAAWLWAIGAILIWPKKVEFVSFSRKNGIVAFDVRRVGSRADEFDAFVATVSEHVRQLRRTSQNAGDS